MSIKEPVGSFERDGESRDVYTVGEATSLRNAGWRLVGEQGPELKTYPDGVRVLSADATAAMLNDPASETPNPETKRSHHRRKDTK